MYINQFLAAFVSFQLEFVWGKDEYKFSMNRWLNNGDVIRSIPNIQCQFQCQKLCSQDQQCLSINFDTQMKICYLNRKQARMTVKGSFVRKECSAYSEKFSTEDDKTTTTSSTSTSTSTSSSTTTVVSTTSPSIIHVYFVNSAYCNYIILLFYLVTAALNFCNKCVKTFLIG